MRQICFDNAATSFPKPYAVQAAVQQALRTAGNPGRGGHALASAGGKIVYHARETAAALFSAEPEHVVFTASCTHALNLAIWGLLRGGGHVLISDLEHNSVARPVFALASQGKIAYSTVHVSADAEETVSAFSAAIRPDTKAVITTLVSNVTGQILPYREIGALCSARGLLYIADGAQACGVLPVSLRDGIRVLCTAGHKGLYGPAGTGMLITDGTAPIKPLMQGGTGSYSQSLAQPQTLPDALESGTANVSGIAGLDAGMQFVMQKTPARIFAHEAALCKRFTEGLAQMPDVTVYRTPGAVYAPVVSFRCGSELPEDTARRLADAGFCLRAGLHCAPLAHRAIGTPEGTVRFAPSAMNTAAEVDLLLNVLPVRGR